MRHAWLHRFCGAVELPDGDIARVTKVNSAWRGGKGAGDCADIPGFYKRTTLDGIRKHGRVLTPSQNVGIETKVEF